MSLVAFIETPGADKNQIERLKAASIREGSLTAVPEMTGLIFRKFKGFYLGGLHEGLSDQANPESDTWDFKESVRVELIRLLRKFSEENYPKFTLFVSWIGETPRAEKNIGIVELCALIESNELGNRVLYRIQSGHPNSLLNIR